MNTDDLFLVGQLADLELVARVKLLAQREREATVVLIAHLAILDERGLYLAEGCSSMFTYCLQVLQLSEHAAYGRIEAARAARKYPIILELLGDGSVNLTTITLLAPHLTLENHVDLLAAAKHQRKRQVEELVARLRPRPSVPSLIRRLPAPNRTPASATESGGSLRIDSDDELPSLSPMRRATPARPTVIAPLAPQCYRVQFTASAETHAKLLQAQDLLRHQIPDGDVGEIIDRALTALLRNLAKQKFAATERPRESVTDGPQENDADLSRESVTDRPGGSRDKIPRSRHIPAEVRRTVWARDGGQCAFTAQNGNRCTARAFLEFHHVVPHAAGGEATVENIQLRCRAHNGYEAELYFGREFCFGRRNHQHRDTTISLSATIISTRSGPS